jgi:hypothetical protein
MEQIAEAARHAFDGGDGGPDFDHEGVAMKWSYFVVAILVVGYAMLAIGAPLIAVIAGVGLAAIMNMKQLGTFERWWPKKRNQLIAPTIERS